MGKERQYQRYSYPQLVAVDCDSWGYQVNLRARDALLKIAMQSRFEKKGGEYDDVVMRKLFKDIKTFVAFQRKDISALEVIKQSFLRSYYRST